MSDTGTILSELYNQILITQATYLQCVNSTQNIQEKVCCQAKYDALQGVLNSIQGLLVQYGGA